MRTNLDTIIAPPTLPSASTLVDDDQRVSAPTAKETRKTRETDISVDLNIDGTGVSSISTGLPFMDHMLELFSRHSLIDLKLKAKGDLEVDYHHTVEDIGLTLGTVLDKALGTRKGITRYGWAFVPMDDALAAVTIDLSNRPYLVCNLPDHAASGIALSPSLTREFFRALVNRAGMNLHINVSYGDNDHHVVESVFKAFGRALDQAASLDDRIKGVRSSKGSL